MNIPEDFKEFLQLLNSNNVEYVLIGGYALAYHGVPRYTGDIDLLIAKTGKNSEKILMVLEEFGMGSLGLEAQDFLTPDNVIQIGYPPLRIDILTDISGVSWQQVWKNKVFSNIADTKIAVISKEDLIQNKKASGRAVDLGDISRLSTE